jgi:hypothetical protein
MDEAKNSSSTKVRSLWRSFQGPNWGFFQFGSWEKKVPKERLYVVLIFAIVAGVTACVLLMAKAGSRGRWQDKNSLIEFSEHYQGGPKVISSGGKTTWQVGYDVKFAPNEELVVVAELYQQDRPMQPLARNVFTGSTSPQALTVSFDRIYENAGQTLVAHNAIIQLGNEVFEIPKFTVDTSRHLNGEGVGWFKNGDLRKPQQPSTARDYATLTRLFSYRSADPEAKRRIWVPSLGVSSGIHHRVVINMAPASRLKHLVVEPVAGCQGLDGQIIPGDLSREQCDKIAERYKHCLTMLLPSCEAR